MGRIKALKLMSVAVFHWKGDGASHPMQRIYGTAFFSQKDLDAFLQQIGETKKRDHRRLGKDLDLFSIQDDAGPGLIFWHPKGGIIRREIEDWLRDELTARGYDLVYTPHAMRLHLWETSGHTGFYRENMFGPMDVENDQYQLKPMNCPGHILIYKSRARSYRELPMRLAELGTVYRYERSGVMHGLLRVRGFTQDDAHIFCMREQLKAEVQACVEFAHPGAQDFRLRPISSGAIRARPGGSRTLRGHSKSVSPYVFIGWAQNGNSLVFAYRSFEGGSSIVSVGTNIASPVWFKLQRSGNIFSGYASIDGVNWALVGSATITMGPNPAVGFSVSSANDTSLASAVFDNVALDMVCTPPTPTVSGTPTPTVTITPSPTITNSPAPTNTPAQPTTQVCETAGKDGIGTLTGIVNTYYPGASSVGVGATSIPLGAPTGSGTAIASGDLLLVIQMQGAGINSNNSISYGDGSTGSGFTVLNGTGRYEFVMATGPVSGGFVPILGVNGGGLLNAYSSFPASSLQGQATYQVIRVPQYSVATLTSGLTAQTWNGSTGGVLAIDVASTLNLNGSTVSVDGMGFRGGGSQQLHGMSGGTGTDYVSLSTISYSDSKGEGIAGTPHWIYNGTGTLLDTLQAYAEGYPNGSFARGAPGNAGGGGTDAHPIDNGNNSGGGGGGNRRMEA